MKAFLLAICFFILSAALFSQLSEDEKKVVFFPKQRIFPFINLDPLTCQTYGGIHVLFEESEREKGVFIPVNLGFSKPFFLFNLQNLTLEIGLEAASYIQFEIVHIEGNTYLGGLYNNDYKSSAYISAKFQDLLYRVRLFHVSSHLGDDYMIRNEDFSRNDKSVNYEQLDLTIMKKVENVEAYAGAGYVITPNAFRERFSLQLGFQFDKDNAKAFHLIGGCDIKLFHQNNYYPNFRAAIGTAYYPSDNPAFRIHLEFYHGHLPYSTQEYRKITWAGISAILEISQ